MHCFWKSHPAASGNDLQMTFTPASYKEGVQSQLDDFPGMTCAAWQQRPESSGYVRARSADPFEKPEIQPNYLADEMDRRVLLGGMRLARRTAPDAADVRPISSARNSPARRRQSDDELLAFASERGTTTFHLMGTCRMAPDNATRPPWSTTGLRVHGSRGCASPTPRSCRRCCRPTLTPPSLMIGEKAADMILGKTAPEPVLLKDAA